MSVSLITFQYPMITVTDNVIFVNDEKLLAKLEFP